MRMSFWTWLGLLGFVGYLYWQSVKDEKQVEKDIKTLEAMR